MPVILAPETFERWLGEEVGRLMRPFPGHIMRMWPISARVKKSESDDPAILEPVTVTGQLGHSSRRLDL